MFTQGGTGQHNWLSGIRGFLKILLYGERVLGQKIYLTHQGGWVGNFISFPGWGGGRKNQETRYTVN